MIYRAKVGLQNSKQIAGYSPMHSPSNRKKTSVLKQNKLSPKRSQRENKQNMQSKQLKTERVKQEKYFKISKQQQDSSSKKPKISQKVSISITIHDKIKNIEQFDDLNILNIQTPKFKCSSNKLDDRCKTQHFNEDENYFSFGEDFRQNLTSKLKSQQIMNFTKDKTNITPLKQKNKNINNFQESDSRPLQKFSITSVKKKQKHQKMKSTQQKLELKFLQIQKQMKDNKFKKDREVFYFKK